MQNFAPFTPTGCLLVAWHVCCRVQGPKSCLDLKLAEAICCWLVQDLHEVVQGLGGEEACEAGPPQAHPKKSAGQGQWHSFTAKHPETCLPDMSVNIVNLELLREASISAEGIPESLWSTTGAAGVPLPPVLFRYERPPRS